MFAKPEIVEQFNIPQPEPSNLKSSDFSDDEDLEMFQYFEDDNKDCYFKSDQLLYYEKHYKPEMIREQQIAEEKAKKLVIKRYLSVS